MREFDIEEFLETLSTIYKDLDRLAPPPRLHSSQFDDSQFYWIFKNVDYEEWAFSNAFSSLFITFPPQSCIYQIAGHFVHVQRKRVSKKRCVVLDFFFMDAKNISEALFPHTLAHQFISQLPDDQKRPVSEVFLQTLLERKLRSNGDAVRFDPRLSRAENISRIVKAELPDLLIALESCISRVADVELSLVFAGMHDNDNISRVQTLASRLEERNVTLKALYMARSIDDMMIVRNGMRHIPYDYERKECLGSLRSSNTRYDLIASEHKGSFEWLWQHPGYREWSGSTESRLLFIEGKPGSGKSTLAKYFKTHHLDYEPAAQDAVFADFFYSNRGGIIETDHSRMLRSILYDILDRNETFFYHFQRPYREYRALPPHLESRQREKRYYEFLKKVIASLKTHPQRKNIYLILDAIDESDDADRQSIIDMLSGWCRESMFCVVKIFVASRPVDELDKHGKSMNHILLQDETREDIEEFATSFLGSGLLRLTGSFLQEATEHVVREAHGVFLWVHLIKEELRPLAGRYRESEIFDKLKELPTGLTELYQHILGAYKTASSRDIIDGTRMLELALFAKRNLTLEEYRNALAISGDINAKFDPSDKKFRSNLLHGIERHIVACGRNYLEIKESQGVRTVQLMHRTVYTFFQSEKATSTTIKINPETAHRNISVTCIRYLLVCAKRTALRGELPDTTLWTSKEFEQYARYLNEMPLLSYVLDCAKSHIDAAMCLTQVTDIQSAVSREIAGAPLGRVLELWPNSPLRTSPVSPKQSKVSHVFRSRLLFAAISLGLVETVKTLLAAGAMVSFHEQKKTPLAFAASLGHSRIMELLLDKDIDINQQGDSDLGGSALLWAAYGGHEEATQLLLDYKADVHRLDCKGQAALHKAASEGHERIVRILISYDAAVDLVDKAGQTAMHVAAQTRQAAVMQPLLDHCVDVMTRDREGRTALHISAATGCEDCMRLLLGRSDRSGVDINGADGYGQTALHIAAKKAHDGSVNLLLDHQAKVGVKDKYGWTPLHVAAGGGNLTTVQLLLRGRGADVDIRGAIRQSPLHIAADNGYAAVVGFLVDEGADASIKDSLEQTPLHIAASAGHEAVVEALIARKVDLGAEDWTGRTALQRSIEVEEGGVSFLLRDTPVR